MKTLLSNSWFKRLAVLLVFSMSLISVAPPAQARFITTDDSAFNPVRGHDLEVVRQAMELKTVKTRLLALGYTPEDVSARLAQLNDEELHQLAVEIDSVQTAGDALGLVIGLVILAILVVVLIKLLDKTIVIN